MKKNISKLIAVAIAMAMLFTMMPAQTLFAEEIEVSELEVNDDELEEIKEIVNEEITDEETVDEETVDEETVDEETVDEETVDEETVGKSIDNPFILEHNKTFHIPAATSTTIYFTPKERGFFRVYTIDSNSKLGGVYHFVNDTEGDEVYYDRLAGDAFNNKEYIEPALLEVGKVYSVTAYNRNYELDVYMEWYYEPATITDIYNGFDGVWIKSNAPIFAVYRRGSSIDPWVHIGDCCESSFYKDTTVVSGQTYEYTVRRYNFMLYWCHDSLAFDGEMEQSGREMKFLPIVPNQKVTNAKNGVRVSWTEVSEATGYYIYRATVKDSYQSSRKYERIATVTDSTTETYTDKTAVSGKCYRYIVRAYEGEYVGAEYVGAASDSLFTIYLNPTVSTLTNTSIGVAVKWTKVAGADGYYIYKSTTGDKDYKKIATVTGLTYTDKNISNGLKYNYKIAPYKTGLYNTYKATSSAVVHYFISRPAISSLTSTVKGKAVVKWARNSKATGYQIQYSPKSDFSSGNKSITISGNTVVSKTIGSLTSGKKYYVRIRTYKKVSIGTYYSAYSATKYITVK